MIECQRVEPSEALGPWQGPGSEISSDYNPIQERDASAPVVDAGSGDYALAELGAACSGQQDALACEGHASRGVLRCNGEKWESFESCPESARCNTELGAEQGTCITVPPACAGKQAGDVCDGQARKTCGVDLISVEDDACQANAHCETTAVGVRCLCDTGYEIDARGRCVNPDDCPASACANGKCLDGLNSFSCDCDAGYAGTGTQRCNKVDYCPKGACVPGGSCVDRPDWSCTCSAGFTGTGSKSCTSIDDCTANACNGHGACSDGLESYACACETGFSGDRCEVDVCTPNPCRNGGTCARTGKLCSCPAGFSGTNCQVDACASCQARAAVCSSSGSTPAVTSYAPSCNAGSCVSGGRAQQPVACSARSDTTCASAQLTSYVPACDANDATQCLSGGRAVQTACPSAAPKCELDSASGRWVGSTYTGACQNGSTCLAQGRETRVFCDELPNACSGNNALDYINNCNGTGCAALSTPCVQQTVSMCNAAHTSFELRNYNGSCAGGQCSYDASTTPCGSAPFCQTVSGVPQSCGGCVEANGTATCRATTTCEVCPAICNANTGLCDRRVVIDPPDCSKPGACT